MKNKRLSFLMLAFMLILACSNEETLLENDDQTLLNSSSVKDDLNTQDQGREITVFSNEDFIQTHISLIGEESYLEEEGDPEEEGDLVNPKYDLKNPKYIAIVNCFEALGYIKKPYIPYIIFDDITRGTYFVYNGDGYDEFRGWNIDVGTIIIDGRSELFDIEGGPIAKMVHDDVYIDAYVCF